MIRIFAVFAMLGMLPFVTPAVGQPRRHIVQVPRDFAECIVRKRADYVAAARARNRQTISIYPSFCPTVQPTPAQINSLATNAGTEPDPSSRTIWVPVRKSACFFNRLAAAQRANPNRNGPISVDITDCG